MCGIFGVIDKKADVFGSVVLGLMSLQHRGQDACGIVSTDGVELFSKKSCEPVNKAFTQRDAKRLAGKAAIGHTRYATQGNGTTREAQPLYLDGEVKIGLAQNGNMVNYFDLKEQLEKKGVQFQTEVDTEVLLNLFHQEYKEEKDVFRAAKSLFTHVRGAFAIVGIIPDKGLFCMRDSHGIRPLVLGKKNGSYAVASETIAFQVTGYEFVRDVAPGEVIFISNDGVLENKVLKQEKKAHCMFEWVYFACPNSMIEGRSVYKARLALGKLLSNRINKSKIDVVVPVPDSGRTAAIKLSEATGIKYREGLIKDRYISRTFIMPSQKEREASVSRKLNPVFSILKDQRVALVDDSIVRGTTSKRLVQMLKESGIRKVTFVSACPPIKYPCFYGIDMTTKKELIAASRSVEEIREYIKADELIYAKVQDVRDAIRRDVCTACLDGNYPIQITEKEQNVLSTQRENEQKKVDGKNVLVIGSGGREHAICRKIANSASLGRLFAAPGNPGMAKIAQCHDIDIFDNEVVVKFAKENNIDLVVVGPEDPLANGIVDALEQSDIKAFGVGAQAARFEASKAFSRKFMKKYGLPSVEFEEFTDMEKAKKYIEKIGAPIVIKADGLAAGKGVLVAHDVKEALKFATDCLKNNKFGEASSKIVVEECLFGEEVSYLVFCDGKTYKPMVNSQDHKPIFEGDKGPNTGGMGTYSPAPILDGYESEIDEKIMQPFLKGIKKEGIDYRGVLYVGLMKTKDGLKILEFNCRFGDPETQVILPRLKSDLLEVFEAVVDKELESITLNWSGKHCMCVVTSSKGYPGAYDRGVEISGVEKANALPQTHVIQAGTKFENDKLKTNGGRVLNVVALGDSLQEAAKNAYDGMSLVEFDGMYFRKDIGKKELDRQK